MNQGKYSGAEYAHGNRVELLRLGCLVTPAKCKVENQKSMIFTMLCLSINDVLQGECLDEIIAYDKSP